MCIWKLSVIIAISNLDWLVHGDMAERLVRGLARINSPEVTSGEFSSVPYSHGRAYVTLLAS